MTNPWIDYPAPVREGEALDVATLTAWLRPRIPGVEGAPEVRQFPRGFSNLTYLLRWGDRELVLRRPPFGATAKGAHDMGREFRILSALEPVFGRVPRPLVHCEDPEVLGAPFYVMERVEGAILRAPVPEDARPSAEAMSDLANGLIGTLVELHAIPVGESGLADVGRPEGYVRRQVEGWAKRYGEARTDDVPAMERVAAWLDEHAPPERGASLIHNDFKYDNLVVDPEDWSEVRAVLDWEMATVGDPWMDVGTSLAYWVDPDDPEPLHELNLSPTTLPGNPSRVELVERYAKARGEDPGPIVFYYAYGLFKLAVVVQQIYARWAAGHTRDPRFARLIHGVRACAWAADRAIDLGRIDRL